MSEDTDRAEVLVVTVETPGTPLMEKSSIVDIENVPPETTLLTMYSVVVALSDWIGWIEKKPLFIVEENVETLDPVSIWALFRTQYFAPTKLVVRKSLALATNLSSLTPMMG